jgi:hypothetical protein
MGGGLCMIVRFPHIRPLVALLRFPTNTFADHVSPSSILPWVVTDYFRHPLFSSMMSVSSYRFSSPP